MVASGSGREGYCSRLFAELARHCSFSGGRPVGLAVDKSGALLIADDVGNAVWRVTPAGQ
jgi:glucose/arabinose dehydrogenase